MMTGQSFLRLLSLMTVAATAISSCGCLAPWKYRTHYVAQIPCADPPPPLGSMTVDPFFQKQEENGEASDFVIYEHEFDDNTNRLNAAGEDHLRQIAARMACVCYPVIIQQSSDGIRPHTKREYPVHNNPDLDIERRDVVVRALDLMGAAGADSRVVVGHALTPGYTQFEAERAYNRGIWGGFGFGGGGFGRGGGLGGLGGGFGGFGGGF